MQHSQLPLGSFTSKRQYAMTCAHLCCLTPTQKVTHPTNENEKCRPYSSLTIHFCSNHLANSTQGISTALQNKSAAKIIGIPKTIVPPKKAKSLFHIPSEPPTKFQTCGIHRPAKTSNIGPCIKYKAYEILARYCANPVVKTRCKNGTCWHANTTWTAPSANQGKATQSPPVEKNGSGVMGGKCRRPGVCSTPTFGQPAIHIAKVKFDIQKILLKRSLESSTPNIVIVGFAAVSKGEDSVCVFAACSFHAS